MKWTPKSSGQEAFDYAFEKLCEGRKDGSNTEIVVRNCFGMRLWAHFLRRNPGATLDDCLGEFERQADRYKKPDWYSILIQLFSHDAYPEFTDRVIDKTPPEGAHAIVTTPSKYDLAEAHVERLRSRYRAEDVRPGRLAEPGTKRFVPPPVSQGSGWRYYVPRGRR